MHENKLNTCMWDVYRALRLCTIAYLWYGSQQPLVRLITNLIILQPCIPRSHYLSHRLSTITYVCSIKPVHTHMQLRGQASVLACLLWSWRQGGLCTRKVEEKSPLLLCFSAGSHVGTAFSTSREVDLKSEFRLHNAFRMSVCLENIVPRILASVCTQDHKYSTVTEFWERARCCFVPPVQ